MYTIYKNNNNKPSLWHAYVCRAQASYLHERASAVVNTNNNKYQKKNNIYVSSFKMNFFYYVSLYKTLQVSIQLAT